MVVKFFTIICKKPQLFFFVCFFLARVVVIGQVELIFVICFSILLDATSYNKIGEVLILHMDVTENKI